MAAYSIIKDVQINGNPNIRYVRIKVNDVEVTLREIFTSLASQSWISKFGEEYLRESYYSRFEPSINVIFQKFQEAEFLKITEDTGELIVSELSRKTLVDGFGYLDLPLGELFKEQVSQNCGFDFFTVNKREIILFGEAKYNSRQSAYRTALKQITEFVSEKKDSKDIAELENFLKNEHKTSLQNFQKGMKGYVAAFSIKTSNDDYAIERIKDLSFFKSLSTSHELICIAVEL